jgi:hypothetical protein
MASKSKAAQEEPVWLQNGSNANDQSAQNESGSEEADP